MASTTANDLIERALVKARVIAPGESLQANKADQVLAELNDMLDSWQLEKLMVIADVLESFSLQSGKSEYTYGSGGDFDSARPIEIKDECFIRDGNTDRKCLLLTLDRYRIRTTKTTQGRPRFMAYNPEYPLMKVFFYPTPDSSSDDVHIRAAKSITSFAALTTSVDLQPGYRRAIVSNLAIEICPNFGKKVPVDLKRLAAEAKTSIKSANTVPVKPMTNPDLVRITKTRSVTDIITGPFD